MRKFQVELVNGKTVEFIAYDATVGEQWVTILETANRLVAAFRADDVRSLIRINVPDA